MKHCWRGHGKDVKGRSSDNCPTLIYQQYFGPLAVHKQHGQFPSKHSNQCGHPKFIPPPPPIPPPLKENHATQGPPLLHRHITSNATKSLNCQLV